MSQTCELCSNLARMLCQSDQASLCWDCDEKVHAANFLVAKHSRTLLCHVCQSPTPWCAAGPNLGRTVSVCNACAHRGAAAATTHRSNQESDTETEEEEEEEEEEDGENQVVPWSDSASDSPPPATSSGSEYSGSFSSSKRTWANNSDESEDEDGGCSSPNLNSDYSCSLRPLKMQRGSSGSAVIPSEEEQCGTAAIVEKLQRFQGDASEMILCLSKLTGD